jgi:class 3 adenylate cyclase
MTRLRRTLDLNGVHGESVLRTVTGGYLLTVGAGELDSDVFEVRLDDGRRRLAAGDAVRASEVLREALRMWRGPALAEVAHADFAQPEIRRLEELRVAAFEARMDCGMRLGEHGEVIGELEALVAAHPGRERLAAQLMLAMYRCGRQADALEVYARTRAYLSGELGLEPGPALQTLQADVLAQSPALERASDSAAATAPSATPRAGAPPTGVVTFLLTDIEGSTRLWEVDAAAMAAALELHDELIALLVARHGGRLLKNRGEGDATLSVFQRASDAVACAAALQHTLSQSSWPSRLDLRVRLALHSGEAQERGGDYVGPVLNRAARLRSLAAGGETVLSQSTAELVRDRLPQELQLVDVGHHELRGLSRPEHVFELRSRSYASAGRSHAAAGLVTLGLPRALHVADGSPFAGRAMELGRLRTRWTEVCDGACSAVLMGGEPGIGKTRLAAELARAVREQDGLVLYGRCDEGLAVPYQPFVEALRPYARAVGLDHVRAELGHLAPELGRLLPELAVLGKPARADPESERFALFEAVAALIEAMTREQPALLILDDLHWSATPALLLLRHLIRSERPLNLLLLGTYRQTEVDPGEPLAHVLADLHRDAATECLRIHGLDESAIAALLDAAVGHPLGDRGSQRVRVLEAQTAGNPFFIRELLATLAEAGEAFGANVTVAHLQPPEGLRQVIGQRVARLSAVAVRVLNVAAVTGPAFSFALLERVLGERSDVLDGLDEAVAAGLLSDAGDEEYVFAHALVRETIYGQLGSARRQHLHRRLAEAVEALGAADAPIEALAYALRPV